MNTLKYLLEQGIVRIAQDPQKNTMSMEELEQLDGYTVPLIDHDYGAGTPVMWNTLYEKKGMNLRNIMVVGNPKKDAQTILESLRHDPKYMGGGAGSGFKEEVIPFLDETRPADLVAVNIIVKEHGRLIGYNTDIDGLVRGLEEVYAQQGKLLEGSHVVVFGAGGVSKELGRSLAQQGVRKIGIVNRTYNKAVALAHHINKTYGQRAYGLPEELIRGGTLGSFDKPDAIINTTNKGSDGEFVEYSAFAPVQDPKTGQPLTSGSSETIARSTLRILKEINPEIIICDIALTKRGETTTLRLARSEGLTNLVDGKPMVIYQAVQAYNHIQEAFPERHVHVDLEEILATFRKAAM